MDFTTLLYQKKDGVARITLNRPEQRNAVDLQTLLDLEEAFEDFNADEALKVAVLTAAGDTFSSGADIKYMTTCTPGQLARFIRKYHQVIQPYGDPR